MKYYIYTLCVLLIFSGCATVKPAKVENGLYSNPEYEFSILMPKGWELAAEPPSMLKKRMSAVAGKKIKAIFTDMKNKRFIIVGAEKTQADWMSFNMYSDKFTASLDGFFAKAKKKFLSNPGAKSYSYEIYADRIQNCPEKCIVSKSDFHFQDLKARGYNIAFLSERGMMYAVSLILVAREEQYANGLEILKTVVRSFQHIDA